MKFAKTITETYRYTYVVEAETAQEADEAFERWSQQEANWERMANDLAESFSHVDVADAEPAGKNQTPDIIAKEV